MKLATTCIGGLKRTASRSKTKWTWIEVRHILNSFKIEPSYILGDTRVVRRGAGEKDERSGGHHCRLAFGLAALCLATNFISTNWPPLGLRWWTWSQRKFIDESSKSVDKSAGWRQVQTSVDMNRLRLAKANSKAGPSTNSRLQQLSNWQEYSHI